MEASRRDAAVDVFVHVRGLSKGRGLELESRSDDPVFYKELDASIGRHYVPSEAAPRIFSSVANAESISIDFARAKDGDYSAAAKEIRRVVQDLGHNVHLDGFFSPSTGPAISGDEHVRELRKRLSKPQEGDL